MRKVECDLSEGYTIAFAKNDDISEIMKFIRNHWKQSHIFALNEDFFRYEFVRDDVVNFVLLKNKESEICGILGFIPYQEKTHRDMFTVMWKVINSDNLFSGVALLEYLLENGECRHIFSSGLNKGTVSIYKYLGFKVGKLEHYYRLNNLDEYHIARIRNKNILASVSADMNCEFRLCDSKEIQYAQIKMDRVPFKSREFILHRYFEHPIYQYRCYEIVLNHSETGCFLFAREERVGESKVLRIVDYIGDIALWRYFSGPVRKILEEGNYEYIDCYQTGIDRQLMNKAGFTMKEVDDTNIIPNYFSPFEQKNIEIYYFCEKNVSPVIFKGDGDQDRPSDMGDKK